MRLRVEQFEDRVVPATRVVTTLLDVVADDGVRSLREAIDQLTALGAGDHTITFDTELHGGTITLDPGRGALVVLAPPGVTGVNISIIGSGVTIQRDHKAQQHHGLFFSGPGTTLALSILALKHGSAQSGGAIVAHGHLSVFGCLLSMNTAAAGGGAIDFDGQTFLLMESTVEYNSAGSGGGISISPTATEVGIVNSTIRYNGAIHYGGGIDIYGSSRAAPTSVTILGSLISTNFAGEKGGGIHAAKVLTVSGVDLTLDSETVISDNYVVNADPAFDTKGGGIYFGKGTIRATSVLISGNDAKSGNGMYRVNGTTLVGMPVYITPNTELVGP